jgi:hypothetical protein
VDRRAFRRDGRPCREFPLKVPTAGCNEGYPQPRLQAHVSKQSRIMRPLRMTYALSAPDGGSAVTQNGSVAPRRGLGTTSPTERRCECGIGIQRRGRTELYPRTSLDFSVSVEVQLYEVKVLPRGLVVRWFSAVHESEKVPCRALLAYAGGPFAFKDSN